MTEITQPLAFQAMQTDIQVSMDDVVSAFVSQYENNLYDRKAELGKTIRSLESDLSKLDKEVLKEVTGSEYANHTLPFGLVITVSDGAIRWNDSVDEKPCVAFGVAVKNQADNSYRTSSINLTKTKPIPAKFVKRHKKISDELEELRNELNEVLISLKSVNRKERQVRGRIAMRKLEDSGYASLMQDPELIQLVQLDD